MRKVYLVISCSRCRRLLLARGGQKSRACPYCGMRVRVDTAVTLYRSENPIEAREFMQRHKRSSQKTTEQ